MNLNSIPTINQPVQQQSLPAAAALTPQAGSASSGSAFSTLLDAINPLQHIPIVSNIFRASQGTSISTVSQLAGDTLYGGLLGGAISSFISSLGDVAVKGATGEGISEHVLSMLDGKDSTSTSTDPGSVSTATALVPTVGADASAIITKAAKTDSTLHDKVDNAVQAILNRGLHPERVAGQYKRAQTLDIGNKLLLKTI